MRSWPSAPFMPFVPSVPGGPGGPGTRPNRLKMLAIEQPVAGSRIAAVAPRIRTRRRTCAIIPLLLYAKLGHVNCAWVSLRPRAASRNAAVRSHRFVARAGGLFRRLLLLRRRPAQAEPRND